MAKDKGKTKAVMTQQAKENEKETDDKFPEGIRVLVVDDDETCLLWVENLLQVCKFEATATLHATEAIQMLRDNKKQFDLVITDIQMPEIDGFQLLEMIGLEMDLPVIMMSIYDNEDYIKRGVLHGAVDYLVKPVKLEAIRKIWQHVLRKRKNHSKGKQIANEEKSSQGAVNDAAGGDPTAGPGEPSNKRHRDPTAANDASEDEDGSDRGENEGQTSQKRPRVVWSPELHKKFVAAINHLGIDKAVPKKILEVMETDTLTRENIASHLQKYRIYLKKNSDKNAQQNMPRALGGRNSLEAMNYSRGPYPYPHSLLPGYPTSLTGIPNFGGMSSSDLIRSGQNLRNSISPNSKLLPNGMPSFQGMPGGFEQDPTHLGEYNSNNGSTGFGVSDNLMDPKAMMMMNGSNNNLMISGPAQFSQTSLPPAPVAFNNNAMNGIPAGAFSFNSMNVIPSTGTQPQLVVGFPHMSVPGPSHIGVEAASGGVLNNYGQDLSDVLDSLEPITTNQNSLVAASGDDFVVQIHGTTPQTMGQQTGITDFIPDNVDSMDDIMNSITRRDNNGSSSMFMDEELNFDGYN
ncbi:hypothetical protein QQ045_015198 [Rhodiola kirilowii]